MRIGYARVSTADQDLGPQVARLEAAGCERIYSDVASGVKASRPDWDRLLDNLRAGDELVITKLDRAGRSVKHLIEVTEFLASRQTNLIVLDQGIDTTTAAGKLLFHIMGAVAEFERDLIRDRTNDGLAAARRKGHLGGRKPKLDAVKVQKLRRLYNAGTLTVDEIAEQFEIHRTTVYDYINAS